MAKKMKPAGPTSGASTSQGGIPPSRTRVFRGGINRVKILVAVTALVIVFLPSFAKYQELYYKNKRLEERIEFLRSENKRLEGEKLRLETDITYIEQKAREKLGVVRKGEIVLKEAPPRKR